MTPNIRSAPFLNGLPQGNKLLEHQPNECPSSHTFAYHRVSHSASSAPAVDSVNGGGDACTPAEIDEHGPAPLAWQWGLRPGARERRRWDRRRRHRTRR